MQISVTTYTQALKSHTAILQTLDRIIGDTLFPLKPFAESANSWDGVPVVYAKYHPGALDFIKNPAAELERTGGKIVGKVNKPRIEFPGKPRLMADLEITDGGINNAIDEGRISLSTGFLAASNETQITGNVIPSHVLVFDETLRDLPRDLGSGFLNGPTDPNSDNQKTIIKRISEQTTKPRTNNEGITNMADQTPAGGQGATVPTGQAPGGMSAQQIAALEKIDVEKFLNMQSEYENKMRQAKAVQDEQYSKIQEMEAKIKTFAQMEKDQKWENLKRQLPRGLVEGTEAEKTREWLNKDPEGLMSHVIGILEQTHQEKMIEQGKQYLNNTSAKIKEESNSLCAGIQIIGED